MDKLEFRRQQVEDRYCDERRRGLAMFEWLASRPTNQPGRQLDRRKKKGDARTNQLSDPGRGSNQQPHLE